MSSKTQNKRKGFTIIELMLAMGFLSVLLVTIALLVIQITGIYQKGLSLRAVNSQGKQLIDEFTRAVGGSPIVTGIAPVPKNGSEITLDDVKRALLQYFVSYDGPGDEGRQVQYGGTFCTGSYSYVWNNWYAHPHLDAGQKGGFEVEGAQNDFKLIRVRDPDRNICAQANHSAAEGGEIDIGRVPNRKLTILGGNFGEPIELINKDESNLILYDFTVFPATQNSITGQTFYSATFILATMRGGINIQSGGDFCQVPSRDGEAGSGSILGLSSDFNYCAVNKFNFAMRATGYTESEDDYGERGVDNK